MWGVCPPPTTRRSCDPFLLSRTQNPTNVTQICSDLPHLRSVLIDASLPCPSRLPDASLPCPSRPPDSASLAVPKPSSRHTTVADSRSHLSSQMVPHSPSFSTSTRPSPTMAPPRRRTSGCWRRRQKTEMGHAWKSHVEARTMFQIGCVALEGPGGPGGAAAQHWNVLGGCVTARREHTC